MNAQERQLLEDFLHQLASVQGLDKDPEADALIRQQSARQPDALYLTIQRSLLQTQALDAAQARIQGLEQKVRELEAAVPVAPPPAPRSFLSGLAGGWGRAPEPASAAYPAGGGSMIGSQVGQRAGGFYGAPAAPAPAYQTAPAAAAPAAGGGMGGFLGTAAMTAAGVAGGMFLFNGIEHLMNGGSNAAGNLAGNGPATENITENVTENVTNNYYGNDATSNASGSQPDTTQVADSGDSGGGWFDDGGFFDGSGDDDIV
ncbi:MAG: hypothetical protein GAK30_02123 [Paracidovorax wautersii]|uniref:DUF2076 domain-containing protein n=1 Tax=Paracidovorax wautersii TaxID=1177982 RepID=A0A7V8FNQ3_9BURK|nr:MAG: hypothetical protein GAK30_02123 [Paracidovorax wautersii]